MTHIKNLWKCYASAGTESIEGYTVWSCSVVPAGLCFRPSTIYSHPLLTWPHVTSAHWVSLNCSQVKDHCAVEGALHDRQSKDPPQRDKEARQTNICAWALTHSQRTLEPVEPPGETGWWHSFWV